MIWFGGSIPEAINAAKQQGRIFVVVITGDDEQSTQLMSSWEDDRVVKETMECCVAIRIDAKSDICVQFSDIYPVVCVPSTFFIGDNGIPLEVIAGSVSANDLMGRINRVKQMHNQASAPVDSSSRENASSASASQPTLSVGSSTIEPATPPPTVKASSPGTEHAATETGPPDHPAQSSQAEQNLHTMRFAKKLEQRPPQKKAEEEKEVRKEHRMAGRDSQDLKRKEEEKTKRLLEERNREKEEERAARQRIKQQIAMDRMERAAHYAKTQEEEKAARQALLQARQAEQEVKKEAGVRERSTRVRIQFRLPDGSSFTNQFPLQARLQEVRQFVVQEVGNRYGNFSMATMFPRRVFTTEDMNKTLVELELAPSASIVILPQSSWQRNAVVQSSGSGIWTVLGTILYPLLAIWRFFSSFVFATPSPRESASRGQSHAQSNSHTSLGADKAKREKKSTQTGEKRPKEFKKDGNICRLRTQEDSEEDNNTWNGNSTQQM
ncbi:UBX domain-containing protein 4 isoform X1 [Takifugu rubripes]|uniref:UBX domain-containing protein 4 n=1 Tax=Takifugu rubripes TaxID=31033 RepID=H2UMQ3_TAKRU|nr:UBX domain-containing protein 4 isoform X1 [Takifugu rubripes]